MSSRGFFCLGLAGMLFGFGSPTQVNARAFLVIGSADALRPADADLKAESLTWLDAAAQRQESTYPDFIKTRKTKGIILAEASRRSVGPDPPRTGLQHQPRLYEERGGWIKRMDGSHRHGPGSEFMVDGDVETWWELLPGGYSFRPGIDLGGIFPVNRIVFYTHPDRPFQYLDEFALLGNDGDPEKVFQIVHHLGTDIEPIFETIYEETESTEWMVVTEFPTPPAPLCLHPGTSRTGGILWGLYHRVWARPECSVVPVAQGFRDRRIGNLRRRLRAPRLPTSPRSSISSKVVPDLPGEQASWGRLHWIGWRDEEAQVIIRTRTGGFDEDEVVPDPTAYSCFTGRGDQLSYQKDGQPLTLSDYRGEVPVTKGTPHLRHGELEFLVAALRFRPGGGGDGHSLAGAGPLHPGTHRLLFHRHRRRRTRGDRLRFLQAPQCQPGGGRDLSPGSGGRDGHGVHLYHVSDPGRHRPRLRQPSDRNLRASDCCALGTGRRVDDLFTVPARRSGNRDSRRRAHRALRPCEGKGRFQDAGGGGLRSPGGQVRHGVQELDFRPRRGRSEAAGGGGRCDQKLQWRWGLQWPSPSQGSSLPGWK